MIPQKTKDLHSVNKYLNSLALKVIWIPVFYVKNNGRVIKQLDVVIHVIDYGAGFSAFSPVFASAVYCCVMASYVSNNSLVLIVNHELLLSFYDYFMDLKCYCRSVPNGSACILILYIFASEKKQYFSP